MEHPDVGEQHSIDHRPPTVGMSSPRIMHSCRDGEGAAHKTDRIATVVLLDRAESPWTPWRRAPPHVLKNPAPVSASHFLASALRALPVPCASTPVCGLEMPPGAAQPPAVQQMVGDAEVQGYVRNGPIVVLTGVYEAPFPSEPASATVCDLTSPALSFSRSR
jgi:hypothetical protein